MGATHAKDRSVSVMAGRVGSPALTTSHQGSPKHGCPRTEVAFIQSSTPPEEPKLTEEDKRYLKETWRTLGSDPTTVGIITFSQLFEENPSMKDMFENFRQIELEDIRASHELKQHAARVMGFVNKIILRLDSEDKYEPLMKELGSRHVSYGAKPQYVDMMGEQFVMVIRPSLLEAHQWDEGAEAAWRKLFQVISHTMKMGLQESQPASHAAVSPKRTSKQATPEPSRRSGDSAHDSNDVKRPA